MGSGAGPDPCQCGEGGEQGGESIGGEVAEGGFCIRPAGNEFRDPRHGGHLGRGFQGHQGDGNKKQDAEQGKETAHRYLITRPGLGPASAFGICEEFTGIDRFANNRKQEGVIG